MFCAAFFLNFRGFSRAKQGTKAEELSTLLLLTWAGLAPRSGAAAFSGGTGARLVLSRQLHTKAITDPSSFLMGAGCRHCPPLARFDERLQYAAGFALCRSLPQPDVAISCFFGSLGRSNSLVGLTLLRWPVPPPVFASSDMAARPDPTAPTARYVL